MNRRCGFPTTDVAVIGGGPAGCAAAITASRSGARVLLLERDGAARDRPGETLHPGIEPLLTWLGAGDLLPAATLARHAGHWVQAHGQRRYLAFGRDATGVWRGFQAWRQTLDGSLRQRAAELGVKVRLGVAAAGLLRAPNGRVTGVVTGEGHEVPAGVVVDASGGRHWLARMLALGVTRLSPRYVASYGYAVSDGSGTIRRRPPTEPELHADRHGWTWIAPLGAQGWHWTRLSFAGRRTASGWLPPALGGLQPKGVSRGADVTWRIARSVAGPGWLMVGDAGAVLDPAASHGVLRALTSGARAGAVAAGVRLNPTTARESFAEFDEWFRAGVNRDAQTLRTSYVSWQRRVS